jgi:serine/threonine protein kinase
MPEIDQTVSHYRIVEKIGQGGMGEVYLADDTTLDRKVALKFLPEAFAIDPERMARFEREAKLLASLNHPNIAGIHGLEEADGNRFLVLEYVEGETLKAKLSKGALPLEDALALCRQIAAGLEAAHEKGVIHRDLKPANVMIMAEEKVKILDFGLAKALTDESQKVDPSDSPTITEGITRPGVVLGTAAYMSPEQAKGKSVDKRADIWAFGCIFYECLTGKKAFAGETVTETLAAVIKEEPDLETAPAKARALLRRCLEKDAKKRLRDIGEAMAWIEVVPESGLESVPVKPPWLAWSVATLATLITIALAWVYFGEKEILPDELMRFQIGYPGNVSPGISNYAISPNGRYLAFCAAESDGIWQVYLRELKSLEIQPLSGTESERDFMLFWSPDSRFIAFEAGRKLKKINIAGGPATTICDLSGSAIGGAWNRDDVIIFGDYNASNGIVRVEVPSGRVSRRIIISSRHFSLMDVIFSIFVIRILQKTPVCSSVHWMPNLKSRTQNSL